MVLHWRKMMEIIDAHVHMGLSEFIKKDEPDVDYDLCCTYEEMISIMNQNNISRAIALPIPYYQYDVKRSNEYILEAYRAYPERFIPFCRIDGDLEHNLTEKGFKGVKLHLLYEKINIRSIKKQLQIIEDACVPLVVHAKFKNKVTQIEEILKYAPNINIVLAHMGRGHLYTGEQVVENAIGLKKYPNVYMDTSTVGDVDAITKCAEIIGYNRVLFGSDYPFAKNYLEENYSYQDDVNRIINAFKGQKLIAVFKQNTEDLLNKQDKKSIKIRRVKKADAEKIIKIIDSLNDTDKKYLSLKNKYKLIKQIILSEKHCYIAVLNDEIVGFMRESGRPENVSLLEEILVSPEYRGRGISQIMIDYYHRIFKKTIAKTNSKNDAIIHLLAKNGYIALNPEAPRIIKWERF